MSKDNSMRGAKKRERQWRRLQPGRKILLTGAAGEQLSGVVDERTDNGNFVWIFIVGGGRKLFHIDDGFAATEL